MFRYFKNITKEKNKEFIEEELRLYREDLKIDARLDAANFAAEEKNKLLDYRESVIQNKEDCIIAEREDSEAFYGDRTVRAEQHFDDKVVKLKEIEGLDTMIAERAARLASEDKRLSDVRYEIERRRKELEELSDSHKEEIKFVSQTFRDLVTQKDHEIGRLVKVIEGLNGIIEKFASKDISVNIKHVTDNRDTTCCTGE